MGTVYGGRHGALFPLHPRNAYTRPGSGADAVQFRWVGGGGTRRPHATVSRYGTCPVEPRRDGGAPPPQALLAVALIHPRRNNGPTPPVGGLRRVVLYSSTSVGILCLCVGMHFFLTRLNINSSTVDGEKHTHTMTSHLHDGGLYFWTGIYTVPWWKINKRTSPFTDDS
jgi:hypothetical protein